MNVNDCRLPLPRLPQVGMLENSTAELNVLWARRLQHVLQSQSTGEQR